MTTYGERLRAARKARGWSQRELGRRVGVSGAAVSRWEMDRTRPYCGARECLVALAFDIDVPPKTPRTVMARIGRQWCQVCKERER